MTRLSLPSVAIATAAMVIACSSAGAPSPSTAAFDGRTYLSTDIEGADLVPGTRIRLYSADGSLNANGGCTSWVAPTRSTATGS